MIIDQLESIYEAIGATWNDDIWLIGVSFKTSDVIALACVVAFVLIMVCGWAMVRSFFK